MKTSLYIAKRYLFSKKGTNAINIISFVSMFGMGLGAAVLIVLLSVFNGFEDVVIELQSSFYPDIQVSKKLGKTFVPSNEELDRIREIDGVENISRVLEENAYLSYDNQSMVAKVKAYDSEYLKVSGVEKHIVSGENVLSEQGKNYTVIGAGVYHQLNARSNEPITVAVPKKDVGNAVLASQMFSIEQIFPSGVFAIQSEFDDTYILTPLSFLQKLSNNKKRISYIEVKTIESQNSKIAKKIEKALGDKFIATTRVEQNKNLYKAMQAEKYAMIAILFFVLLIISFTIVGALSMLAMDKSIDISILKSFGARRKMIFNIFLLEGVLGSMVGSFVGVIVGVVIVLLQQYLHIVKLGGDGFFVIDAYPVKLQLGDIFIAIFLVFFISLIASWLPAKRAADNKLSFRKY